MAAGICQPRYFIRNGFLWGWRFRLLAAFNLAPGSWLNRKGLQVVPEFRSPHSKIRLLFTIDKDSLMTAQPANAGEIAQRLIEEVAIIRSLDPATLSPETPLSEIGIDSLGLVEILVFIEKTYSLNLLESGLSRQHLRSISTIAQGVWEKRFGSRS